MMQRFGQPGQKAFNRPLLQRLAWGASAGRGPRVTANERVRTGIFGLDSIIEGGFRRNTAVVLAGSSGTGKTTFAIQFVLAGLEQGEQALYISMEETPEQILRDSKLMGLDLSPYVDKTLFFVHLRGENFKRMIREQLPKMVRERSEEEVDTRVAIDPVTPLLWASSEKLDQRELVSELFNTLKQLGVVLATVEEHSQPGAVLGQDVLLPVYLADGAIHLEYYPIGGAFNRTLKILKMRGTQHGEELYPYTFVRGAGAVIRTSPLVTGREDQAGWDPVFERAVATAKDKKYPPGLVRRIETLRSHWSQPYSPEETLHILFESYKRG
jgi:KaiC/GvpD/RAD55 family RecA-like ATPase